MSLTVILSAGTSAITFPPSRIEARLAVAAAVATGSIFTSSVALVTMTSLHVDIELGIAVVTAAAFAVAFASVWAVGVMVSNLATERYTCVFSMVTTYQMT